MLGPKIERPDWFREALVYYSWIENFSYFGGDVRIMRFPTEGVFSEENQGTLCLRLVSAGFFRVVVRDASGIEPGKILTRLPGFLYSMRRGEETAWTLSVRSLVQRRHALRFVHGEAWDVRTPFFWWMNVVCRGPTGLRVVGRMEQKRCWLLFVELGHDPPDVLAALAFLHRRWNL